MFNLLKFLGFSKPKFGSQSPKLAFKTPNRLPQRRKLAPKAPIPKLAPKARLSGGFKTGLGSSPGGSGTPPTSSRRPKRCQKATKSPKTPNQAPALPKNKNAVPKKNFRSKLSVKTFGQNLLGPKPYTISIKKYHEPPSSLRHFGPRLLVLGALLA